MNRDGRTLRVIPTREPAVQNTTQCKLEHFLSERVLMPIEAIFQPEPNISTHAQSEKASIAR
jgi:hypothetical protein